MMLPQRPYFPIGSLQAAIAYPAEASAFSPDQVGDVLISVGLPSSPAAGRGSALEPDAVARRAAAPRGSRARCCTRRNICSSMKPPPRSMKPSEAALYQLLEAEIAGHHHRIDRPSQTLQAFHQRNVVLTRDGDRFALRNRSEDAKPS